MNGDDLNRIVLESGPTEAAAIVNQEFGPILRKRISSYLRLKHCRNHIDHSSDVVNDMWISVIKDFTRFYQGKKNEGYSYPLSWLMAVAVTCCNRHLASDIRSARTYETETELEFEYDLGIHVEHARIYAGNVEKEYEITEAKAALKALIRELPLKSRVVIQLYLDGLASAEIAETLFLSEAAVRQTISRTTRRFRDISSSR